MILRRSLLSCCITLILCASVAFAQAQGNLPRLQIKNWNPAPKLSTNAPVNAGTGLPLFTYAVKSSRDHNNYSGAIVGNNPFNHGGGAVSVHAQIVPIVILTRRVATRVSKNGIISTQAGESVFDPTQADNACLTAPNNVPLRLFQQSPIFKSTDFSFGGTNVGTTQYIDAFQRAQFWDIINRDTYHMKLGPITTLDPVVIIVPAKSGLSLPPALFGTCGPMAIVDINLFDSIVTNTILPTLIAKGVNPGTFPIFQLYNVGLSIGDPTNLNNCCALGYHSFAGAFQTYSPSDFDTTGLFGPLAMDTAVSSHEVGEWANDPTGFNPTPAWGNTGQVVGCQNNLEVGDPLTGTNIPNVVMPNGFSYHLQELAFFSWFYSARTLGLNGWFSNNGTFLSDAGPPCAP